jgi:hypothetical protein
VASAPIRRVAVHSTFKTVSDSVMLTGTIRNGLHNNKEAKS